MAVSDSQTYRSSISGADVDNICWFSLMRDGEIHTSSSVNLETLTTISISVHESKSPVRALGHKAVKGFTGSVRSIAGTMVFTVINDHPLERLFSAYNEIRDKIGPWSWSQDSDRNGGGFVSGLENNFDRVLPTYLPPFNIALLAVNELAEISLDSTINVSIAKMPYSKTILLGVEFTDDGFQVSTNNPMTEYVFSFVAQDYVVLGKQETNLFISSSNIKKESGSVSLVSESLDQQKVWMENFNITQTSKSHSHINYQYDDNGDIVGIITETPDDLSNINGRTSDRRTFGDAF